MRLGVLDVGSNTVHLLVVDAHRGGHPTPTLSEKRMLRLAENVNKAGRLSKSGAQALIDSVADAKQLATKLDCVDLLAFATSAVRDATNAGKVLARVEAESGVPLRVLSGEDEARLTFLAVRRWYGWSAGRVLVLDIGGGSLEVAGGVDEDPDIAVSLPLGAGRLTRERLSGDPPSRAAIEELRGYVEGVFAPAVRSLSKAGAPDRVVATSKTFRSLARLAGAAPSSAGPRAARRLTMTGLHQVMGFVARIGSAELAELDGVSAGRAHQLLAGGVVAESAMRALAVDTVDICPWALREGVILRRLDWLSGA